MRSISKMMTAISKKRSAPLRRHPLACGAAADGEGVVTTATVESRNPWSGARVYRAEAADREQVVAAVGRAEAALPGWRGRPVSERSELLHRFADEVEQAAEDLTDLIVAEVGKLREEAAAEVAWMATSARWYGAHPPADERATAIVRRLPLGVVAAITPWNVPLVTPGWKWLPALMAGNTVVWKPSELSTATAMATRELADAAGLPGDVLHVVAGGPDTGSALCADERVAGVHFTGSTAAGRAIGQQVVDRFARCSLEMSGINVAVVFADADVAEAAEAIVASATAINGQKCSATRQVLVEREVEPALLEAVSARIESLEPGDPADPRTGIGPLIHRGAAARAREAVRSAAARGAGIVAQSAEVPEVEAAFPATVLTDVAASDPLHMAELFAPVLAVEGFDDRAAVWDRANDTPYGLTAAIHTRDAATVEAGLQRLRTGVVAINRRSDDVALEAPFGGLKSSGYGSPEGGIYVYEGLTVRQAVYGS